MTTVNWSDWYTLDSKSMGLPVPDLPGVYEVQTDFAFGRLNGYSSVVYIGSAVPSLKTRLIDQRIGNPERFLSRAEKLLYKAGHALQFRYTKTADGIIARNLESLMLIDYEREHWELPPGNSMLPKARTA
jgi:hypothetical protein